MKIVKVIKTGLVLALALAVIGNDVAQAMDGEDPSVPGYNQFLRDVPNFSDRAGMPRRAPRKSIADRARASASCAKDVAVSVVASAAAGASNHLSRSASRARDVAVKAIGTIAGSMNHEDAPAADCKYQDLDNKYGEENYAGPVHEEPAHVKTFEPTDEQKFALCMELTDKNKELLVQNARLVEQVRIARPEPRQRCSLGRVLKYAVVGSVLLAAGLFAAHLKTELDGCEAELARYEDQNPVEPVWYKPWTMASRLFHCTEACLTR